MTDVVVIGSVNLDLSASVERLPQAGETVTGAVLHRFPGGKGANQALAARRLGANVKLIACVGNDANASEALELLNEGEVDLSHCVIDNEAATGAGDTFTAALTVALVEDRSPEVSLEFACTAAAIATTIRGAQPSLPTRAAVYEYINGGGTH